MAKFCAEMCVKYDISDKSVYVDMLYKGHRGFISLSEDDLAKEFDKKLHSLRDKYSVLKDRDDKAKNDRWYRQSDEFVELSLWYEEGVSIADEIFEERFLT